MQTINSERKLEIAKLADIEASNVSFLLPPYLPKGKQTLLVGDPGEGKTWIALDIAARVTQGWELPVAIPLEGDDHAETR